MDLRIAFAALNCRVEFSKVQGLKSTICSVGLLGFLMVYRKESNTGEMHTVNFPGQEINQCLFDRNEVGLLRKKRIGIMKLYNERKLQYLLLTVYFNYIHCAL